MIAGFDVDCSRDGEEALARMLAAGVPDVIVLDLGLPRIESTRRRRDGFDLLDTLRANRLTDTLRVLAMSNDHDSLIEALHRGASHCMPSHVTASSLVRVVKDVIDDRTPRGWFHADD
jgi:DNA-binding NarL/FixJ family response regulator